MYVLVVEFDYLVGVYFGGFVLFDLIVYVYFVGCD